MGRIAYLSKRGNIWWFRRRFPVIFIKAPQSDLKTELYFGVETKAQAQGHLAISLQTSSLREARLIGAQVSADFERAWTMVEAQMNETDLESDMLDAIAMAMTNGFRSYIGALRTGIAANQDPRVKERAYRIVEADIRNALGIETEPPTQVSASTPIDEPNTSSTSADTTPEPDEMSEDELITIETEMEVYEQHTLLSHIGPSARTQDDYYAEHIVNEFSVHTAAFRVTISEYLEACEHLGLDPRMATPDFESALKEALKAAKDIGLAQEAAIKTERNPAGKEVDADQAKRMFSDFAEEYLSLRCKGYDFKKEDETADANSGRRFEKSSLRNWQSSIRIFTEIVGDFPIGQYTKDDIIEFNDLVQRLPSNFGKSSKDKRTAREVIEETETEEERTIAAMSEALRSKGLPETEIDDELAKTVVRRISANTMKRHQTALGSMFRRALEIGAVRSNPFKGRTLTTREIANRQMTERRVERVGWGDHIKTLFASEKFTTPLSDVGDPLFWAPLIATFAGLRMEEILQLRLDDFGTDEGVHFLAVQNSLGTQSLKSANALRRVPLHRALIDLGLLKLVAYRRSQKMNRLFPNINRSKSKGTLSGTLSKNFGYYLVSRGIKEPGLDFHALRTDFLTRLTRARVPDHVRKGLMGHDQTDVTHKSYFRAGETMPSLKEYVDRIDINYSGVLPPLGWAETYKGGLRIVGGGNT